MVNLARLFLVMSLTAVGCSSEPRCTKGSEFEPPLCPSDYTQVAAVRIDKNAAMHPMEKSSEGDCQSFLLNADIINRYFELAKVTNENDAHHTVDWSPCFASGDVEFQNGKKAYCEISQLRVGELMLGDGKKVVLYCPDCRFPPFR